MNTVYLLEKYFNIGFIIKLDRITKLSLYQFLWICQENGGKKLETGGSQRGP